MVRFNNGNVHTCSSSVSIERRMQEERVCVFLSVNVIQVRLLCTLGQ